MSTSQAQHGRLPAAEPPGRVIHVPPDRREEAVNRLLAVGNEVDPSRTQRFLSYARANQVGLDAMWAWLDETGRIRYTVLAVPNPGRTAMFFASHPSRRIDVAPLGRLIDHGCEAVGRMDVHLAQALLDPSEVLDREAFHAAGFNDLARLSYLERPIPRRRAAGPVNWPAGVRVEPYREPVHTDEVVDVLERSYDGTLDCPGLRGLRETRDVLAGHRAAGQFEPALWTVLRIDEQASGVLLLNPSPAQQSIELVYLGLVPEARGRGLGRRLLRHGFSLLAPRKERSINLAVDERNAPALGLYESEGFRRALRRVAMIRSLRETGERGA